MRRKLPRCYGCGKPLAGVASRMVVTVNDVIGRPSFGACMGNGSDCSIIMPFMFGKRRAKMSEILRRVDQRGPGRLVIVGGHSLEIVCIDSDVAELKARRKGKA